LGLNTSFEQIIRGTTHDVVLALQWINFRIQMNRRYAFMIGSAIAWFAVAAQYYLLIEATSVSFWEATARFFSYFTILTNTLVALFLTSRLSDEQSRFAENP
jgi:hypothetical protein